MSSILEFVLVNQARGSIYSNWESLTLRGPLKGTADVISNEPVFSKMACPIRNNTLQTLADQGCFKYKNVRNLGKYAK